MTILLFFSLFLGSSNAFFIAQHSHGGKKEVDAGATGDLSSQTTGSQTSGTEAARTRLNAAHATTTDESSAQGSTSKASSTAGAAAAVSTKTETATVVSTKAEAATVVKAGAVTEVASKEGSGAQTKPNGPVEVKVKVTHDGTLPPAVTAHVTVQHPESGATDGGAAGAPKQVSATVTVKPAGASSSDAAVPAVPSGPGTHVAVVVGPKSATAPGDSPVAADPGSTHVTAHVTHQAAPSAGAGATTHVTAQVAHSPTDGSGKHVKVTVEHSAAGEAVPPPLARRGGVATVDEPVAPSTDGFGERWDIEGFDYIQETDANITQRAYYGQQRTTVGPWRSLGDGVASYHFAVGGSYISYTNAPPEWHLDTNEMPPVEKYWEDATYDNAQRRFTGVISWPPPATFMGDASWTYEINFSEDLKKIVSGTVRCLNADGRPNHEDITYTPDKASEVGGAYALYYEKAPDGVSSMVQFGNQSVSEYSMLAMRTMKLR